MDWNVKAGLEKHQQIVKKFLESVSASSAADVATSTYDRTVSVASAGGGYLNADFKKNGNVVAKFQGGFAGALGGYRGWGTAWFSVPVEGLIGQSAAFTAEVVGILGGTARGQITNANDFIGNCSTGGIGARGAGVGGGKFVSP